MSIRTTVTLDDDVAFRAKQESLTRGASFRDTLNDLLLGPTEYLVVATRER